MTKMKLSDISKCLLTTTKKHSPEILTGLGIAGMITTTIMAVKATPKALIAIGEKKEELEKNTLSGKEIITTAGPCYIPSAVVGVVSIVCLVCASSTNLRRNAALMTAYTLSESTLKEYQDKVTDVIGEEKEKEIHEEVIKEKAEKNPIRNVIITENGGNTVCYDVISCRYFKSDKNTILSIVNDLNMRMISEDNVTLNDFYYALGLDESKIGDDLGWSIDKGGIKIDFLSRLDANGTPCLVLDYLVAPIYDYR